MPTSYGGTLLDHLAKYMVYLLLLAAAANVVVFVIVDLGVVIVAIIIVSVAVVALAFVLRCSLILLSRWVVVACYFTSVAGVFVAHPLFG